MRISYKASCTNLSVCRLECEHPSKFIFCYISMIKVFSHCRVNIYRDAIVKPLTSPFVPFTQIKDTSRETKHLVVSYRLFVGFFLSYLFQLSFEPDQFLTLCVWLYCIRRQGLVSILLYFQAFAALF